MDLPSEHELREIVKDKRKVAQMVSSLKQELERWKRRVDAEVQATRCEFQDLRASFGDDLVQLRRDFAGLRNDIQTQHCLALAAKAGEWPESGSEASKHA